MAEILYAEWTEIEERIQWAVEEVLTAHDSTEPGPDRAEIEHAQKVAKQVVNATMFHLDGYTVADLTERAERTKYGRHLAESTSRRNKERY